MQRSLILLLSAYDLSGGAAVAISGTGTAEVSGNFYVTSGFLVGFVFLNI